MTTQEQPPSAEGIPDGCTARRVAATGQVLAAGVGNIFLGDDGFGVEVAHRLMNAVLPVGVRVADFGIRGMHLAYELLDGYQALVLIDAVSRGQEPGTLYVLEADLEHVEAGTSGPFAPMMDAHQMSPDAVFAMLEALGGRLDQRLIIGCEPADCSQQMRLSEPVAAAVEPAVELAREVLADVANSAGGAGKESGKETSHEQAVQVGSAGRVGGWSGHGRAVPG